MRVSVARVATAVAGLAGLAGVAVAGVAGLAGVGGLASVALAIGAASAVGDRPRSGSGSAERNMTSRDSSTCSQVTSILE